MQKRAREVQINLLHKEAKPVLGKLQNLFRQTSFILLVIYLFALLALFGVFLFFNRQERMLTEANEALISQVEALREKEGLLVLLKNRIGLSRNIFGKSITVPPKEIEEAITAPGPGIQIAEVTSDETGRTVIGGSADTSGSLENFFEALKAKKFKSLTLKSLELDSTKGYVFFLEIF